MMYHINGDNQPKQCRASEPFKCKFYQGESDSRHFEDINEAIGFAEKLNKEDNADTMGIRYSFTKNFKKIMDDFKKDFDGVPTRFYNYDIPGKTISQDRFGEPYVIRKGEFAVRIYHSLSSTSDLTMSNEKVIQLLNQEGFTDIQDVSDDSAVLGTKYNRAWKAKYKDKTILISDGNSGNDVNRYYYKRNNKYFERGESFANFDIRKLAGASRFNEKKEKNEKIYDVIFKTKDYTELRDKYYASTKEIHWSIENLKNKGEITEEERRIMVKSANKKLNRVEPSNKILLKAYDDVLDMQLEGRNFKSQEKFIKSKTGSVATAYMDKKNISKEHQEIMKTTSLNKTFKKVELDSDVDLTEFKNFENAYHDIEHSLPVLSKDLAPTLRIRKLGKHSSGTFKVNGMFFPHKNTLVLDPSTSSAFIHEYGHYLDIAVNNNASLQKDFRPIIKEYTKNLKTENTTKPEYYTNPSEIIARSFEIYANEKLGINNRLLNKEKFKNFDYQPIMENPELKETIFNFIDKAFYDKNKS